MNLSNLPKTMANDYRTAVKIAKGVPNSLKMIGSAVAHIPSAFVSTPGLKQKKANKK